MLCVERIGWGQFSQVPARCGRAPEQLRHVNSIEICGPCHGSMGGIDGCIEFKDYPSIHGRRDRSQVQSNVQKLQAIVRMSHESGKPVLFWHREVVIPYGLVEAVPELLDESHEFDLLGSAYHDLLRSKVREFFETLPEIDGLVLTLTEAEYSVIHHSNQQKYDAPEVVNRMIRTFAQECRKLGKIFSVRTFGSCDQDYENILKGVELALTDYAFEIETKVVPYDWNPFLPNNPFLYRLTGGSLCTEFDSLGEYYGIGFLPAGCPDLIVRYVRYAQSRQTDRFAVRVDRNGISTFESVNAINGYAFTRAIEDVSVDAETIWREWAEIKWSHCPREMISLMKQGMEVVKKSLYIDGHLISHGLAWSPTLSILKLGGIFSIFKPNQNLSHTREQWGILSDRTSPDRQEILKEKEQACQVAQAGLSQLATLKERLDPSEYLQSQKAWDHALYLATMYQSLCECFVAYFEDMEAYSQDCFELVRAVSSFRQRCEKFLHRSEYRVSREKYQETWSVQGCDVKSILTVCVLQILDDLLREYEAEFLARRKILETPGLVDFVICGGLCDEYRLRRYTHGSGSEYINGQPARSAGTNVFPFGFLEYKLKSRKGKNNKLLITGDSSRAKEFKIWINNQTHQVRFQNGSGLETTALAFDVHESEEITVRLEKSGRDTPWFTSLAVYT